jgi:hypothetical protein
LRYQRGGHGIRLHQKSAGWLVSQQKIDFRRILRITTANQEKTDLAAFDGGDQQVALGMLVGQGLDEHQLRLAFGVLNLKKRLVPHNHGVHRLRHSNRRNEVRFELDFSDLGVCCGLAADLRSNRCLLCSGCSGQCREQQPAKNRSAFHPSPHRLLLLG